MIYLHDISAAYRRIQHRPSFRLSWITLRESNKAPRIIQQYSIMENGSCGTFISSHAACYSYHVWLLSSLNKLSDTSSRSYPGTYFPFHSSFSTIILLELCRILSRQMGFEGRRSTISDEVS